MQLQNAHQLGLQTWLFCRCIRCCAADADTALLQMQMCRAADADVVAL